MSRYEDTAQARDHAWNYGQTEDRTDSRTLALWEIATSLAILVDYAEANLAAPPTYIPVDDRPF